MFICVLSITVFSSEVSDCVTCADNLKRSFKKALPHVPVIVKVSEEIQSFPAKVKVRESSL